MDYSSNDFLNLKTVGSRIFMAIAFGLLFILILIACAVSGEAVYLIFGIPLLIASIYHAYRAYRIKQDEIEEERRIAYEQELKRQKEKEQNELYASGKWKFPRKEFYELCRKNGATDMENAFCLQKARLLAQSLLREAGVPQQYHRIYANDEKVKDYYSQWHSVVEALNNKRQQELERNSREPQRANLSASERATISTAESLKNTYGREKRRNILTKEITAISNAIKDLDTRIANERKNRESSRQNMNSIIEANARLNNAAKQNWGVAGGIADAIAGPGAGIVAAGEAMRRNAEIDEKTRAESKQFSQFYFEIENRSFNNEFEMEREKKRLTAKLKELEDERTLSLQKVVLEDVSTDEIKKYISPKVVSISRNNNNVLEVTVKVNNKYIPQVPDNVKVVVDGVISADIFSEKIHVGTAYIPFPLYGIPCNQTVNLVGLCPYYLEGDHKYTLKYTYHKLWVMEQ